MCGLKFGLSLSGGGAKGAFIVGVLQAFREVFPDAGLRVISGTSTGALIGSLAAAKDWELMEEIYTGVETEDIITLRHSLFASLVGGLEGALLSTMLLGGSSVYTTEPLEKLIAEHIDFEKLIDLATAKETLLILNAVDMQMGAVQSFDTATTGADVLPRALLASANQPVFTPLVPIQVNEVEHQFSDGGLREFLPISPIFDAKIELDHILAISTEPERPTRGKRKYEDLFPILVRTVEILTGEVGFMDAHVARLTNAILRMKKNATAKKWPIGDLMDGVPDDVQTKLFGKSEVGLSFIGPKLHLEMDSLRFIQEEMEDAMEMGLTRGREKLEALKDALP